MTHSLMVRVRTTFIWHQITTNCGNGCYFRDYLLKHPDEAQKYACLKQELGEKFADDREAYTTAKGEYIQTVTERALRNTKAT